MQFWGEPIKQILLQHNRFLNKGIDEFSISLNFSVFIYGWSVFKFGWMIWLFIKPKTKANLQFANFSVWIFISAKQSVPQVTIAYGYNISWPQRMKLRWNCRSFKKVGNLFRREIFINWRSHFATIFPLCYWRRKKILCLYLFLGSFDQIGKK